MVLGSALWVTNSPLFDMRRLVVTGASHVSAADVARLGRLGPSTNVLWLSTEMVARRIEADPWVQSVTVSRQLPSTLSVIVTERAPVAALSGSPLLVSGDGTILALPGTGTDLPKIVVPVDGLSPGSRIAAAATPALLVARTLPAGLIGLVRTIGSDPTTGLTLELRGGIRAFYGDASEAAAKAAAVQAVLAWAQAHGVRAATVDVRAPGAPALRLSGAFPSPLPTP
jgi:cell division protein FtsQ